MLRQNVQIPMLPCGASPARRLRFALEPSSGRAEKRQCRIGGSFSGEDKLDKEGVPDLANIFPGIKGTFPSFLEGPRLYPRIWPTSSPE